jgi:hypothetical protein
MAFSPGHCRRTNALPSNGICASSIGSAMTSRSSSVTLQLRLESRRGSAVPADGSGSRALWLGAMRRAAVVEAAIVAALGGVAGSTLRLSRRNSFSRRERFSGVCRSAARASRIGAAGSGRRSRKRTSCAANDPFSTSPCCLASARPAPFRARSRPRRAPRPQCSAAPTRMARARRPRPGPRVHAAAYALLRIEGKERGP